ncbi:7e55bfcd-4b9e-485e-8bff-a1e710308926 [Sclerotinia trifoliorum]|uniref:7e55bfcd-4b9e-485e-8bff-a1e710308926 n=1 Tax=Sclerotinia trifoliorum TaxID=28548 RepID=A0A8H2W230_9HELO|nr:7e55bfcd-4b9e-485e-8bff-a1e710308926 [Sclerotinia trifoliorum]
MELSLACREYRVHRYFFSRLVSGLCLGPANLTILILILILILTIQPLGHPSIPTTTRPPRNPPSNSLLSSSSLPHLLKQNIVTGHRDRGQPRQWPLMITYLVPTKNHHNTEKVESATREEKRKEKKDKQGSQVNQTPIK